MILTSRCCCPGGCDDQPKRGWSFGSVLCVMWVQSANSSLLFTTFQERQSVDDGGVKGKNDDDRPHSSWSSISRTYDFITRQRCLQMCYKMMPFKVLGWWLRTDSAVCFTFTDSFVPSQFIWSVAFCTWNLSGEPRGLKSFQTGAFGWIFQS